MKRIIIILCCFTGAASAAPLDLPSAIQRVTAHHPALAAAEAEIEARSADARQAGLLQNPTLGVEAENILGSGDFSATDSAEFTFMLSQTIELGGKRGKRRKAASLSAKTADWDLVTIRQQLELQTIQSFFAAMGAEINLSLAQKQIDIARSVVEKARQRVDAGRAHRLEVTRAMLELKDAELQVQTAQQRLTATKKMLAALWGGSADDITELICRLEDTAPPPPLAELTEQLQQHPAVMRSKALIQQMQAETDLAEAMRIPDIEVGAGLRLIEESDDQALVFGIALPLGFSDRNQGGREAAITRATQARSLQTDLSRSLQRELLTRQLAVQTSYTEATSLRQYQLPTARQAFAEASDGYEKGLFSSLELLDAMRGLFAQEARYTNTLLKYQQARAELSNLVSLYSAK